MRNDLAILIEIDDDFDPATSYDSGDPADNAAYVAQHERGELTAYGVSVVRVVDTENCTIEGLRYGDGSYGPVRLASLWGCDVENGTADGLFFTLESVPDEYLRTVAEDLLGEVE